MWRASGSRIRALLSFQVSQPADQAGGDADHGGHERSGAGRAEHDRSAEAEHRDEAGDHRKPTALERLNGLPARSHIGRTFSQVLPGLHGQATALREVLTDGMPREVTISGRTWAPTEEEQQLWRASYHRLDAEGEGCRLMAIVVEITDIARQREELERARGHVALLSTAAVRIGTTLDMDTTCRELADFVVPDFADVAVVDVFPADLGHTVRRPEPGVVRLRRAALRGDGDLDEQVQRFGHPGEYIDFAADAAVTRCLTQNEPVIDDWENDQRGRSARTADRIAASRALGLRQALVVPLTARSLPLGTLSLVRAEGSPAFGDQDVAVARELAVRAGVDIDHARRYDHEHSIARELQRSLLSEPWGPRPHVEIATRYLPADEDVLVGGDWFDVVPLQDGRHLKAMGDVMGHGVEAAVAMSQYRSLLRLLAQEDLPPHEILEQLDTMVERSGLDRAATCLLAVVDRFGGVCEVASAGHVPGLHRPGRRRGPGGSGAGGAAARHRVRRLPDRVRALWPGDRAVHVHRRSGGAPGRGHRRLRAAARLADHAAGRTPGGPAGPGSGPVRRGRGGRHRRPRVPDPRGAAGGAADTGGVTAAVSLSPGPGFSPVPRVRRGAPCRPARSAARTPVRAGGGGSDRSRGSRTRCRSGRRRRR
ncbi:hypothetical protein SBADM41S_03002 [Streptomyces badius]